MKKLTFYYYGGSSFTPTMFCSSSDGIKLPSQVDFDNDLTFYIILK